MSIEGLIGIVLMLVIGAIGLLFPFFGSKSKVISKRKLQFDLSRDELISSYERVLTTLRDLEDDFKSHKINPDDYEHERAYWSKYGVQLLQLLDNTTQDSTFDENSLESNTDDSGVKLDQNVEQAILNYRVALQSVDNT